MELRSTREMRRNEQLTRAMAKKADTADAPATAQSTQRQPAADKVSLSQQALDFVREQNQNMWQQVQAREQRRQGSQIDGILDAMETENQKLDYMSKMIDMMGKCQKIAAAIMRGDRVPPEDLRYLMEHDQEGYKMALAMRKPKKDPEDVESVLDDEDKNDGSAEGAEDSGEIPAVEASAPSSGSGDAGAAVE